MSGLILLEFRSTALRPLDDLRYGCMSPQKFDCYYLHHGFIVTVTVTVLYKSCRNMIRITTGI